MRAYIRLQLDADYRIIEASDGEEGLELARQTIPDLIISDVMMPKLDGYQLCREIKSEQVTSHIPVLLLTAKSSQSSKLEGLNIGADDYLSKPFDSEELRVRIENLIRTRRLLIADYQQFDEGGELSLAALPEKEQEFLNKLRSYVEERIDNPKIYIGDLSEQMHMSVRSMQRKIRSLTGAGPQQFILSIRLEHAAFLIREQAYSPTEACYASGFSGGSYFSRKFKERYQLSPSEYLANHT